MKTYQITKYNPANRNDKGFYIVDEWTAISDIGKNYNGTVFTTKEYRKVEDNYINVLNYITNELGLENFKIIELIKLGLTDNDYQELYSSEILNVYEIISDSKVLNVAEMLYASRLMLREDIHGTIVEINSKLKIEFGYDFYMYVTFKGEAPKKLEINCNKYELFIE